MWIPRTRSLAQRMEGLRKHVLSICLEAIRSPDCMYCKRRVRPTISTWQLMWSKSQIDPFRFRLIIPLLLVHRLNSTTSSIKDFNHATAPITIPSIVTTLSSFLLPLKETLRWSLSRYLLSMSYCSVQEAAYMCWSRLSEARTPGFCMVIPLDFELALC